MARSAAIDARMRGFLPSLLLVSALLSWQLAPLRADWSQFLGPTRDGHSAEMGILRRWPETGPKELWSGDVGPGFGGAAIRDGEVYLFDREDDARNVLRCFDHETGEELWRLDHPAPGRLGYNGSRSVPAVGERLVFACDPFGRAVCVDRESGELVWQTDLVATFEGKAPSWGYASSPLLVGDAVILTALGRRAGLVALEQATGELMWKTEGLGGESYCSPALHQIAGREVLLFLGRKGLYAFAPDTGETLLHYTGYQPGGPIPAPTAVGEDRFLLTGGYGAGTMLVQVEAQEGGGYEVSEVFEIKADGAQIHQAILLDGHIYANFNRNENDRRPAGLVCIGLDGRVRWKTGEAPAIGRGNLIAVDGLLLVLGGDDGVLRLVEPSPDGYQEVASAPVFEGLRRRNNRIWAPMAFSEGLLVLRNQQTLKCLDLRGPRID